MAIPTCSNFLSIFGNTFLFTKYFPFLFDFSIIFSQLSNTKIGSSEVSAQTDVRFSGYEYKEMFRKPCRNLGAK